ncbi:MAG: hypothetical protein OXL37_03550 [Chloroflexota bacterium]|nr:hypothetical protein [Chloroflexota bacterium]MDE2958608.1 hypothetical protein [Chloroflexota bacterium]
MTTINTSEDLLRLLREAPHFYELSDLEKSATDIREIKAKLTSAGYDRYIPRATTNSNRQVASE